jgi:hypothetical protein
MVGSSSPKVVPAIRKGADIIRFWPPPKRKGGRNKKSASDDLAPMLDDDSAHGDGDDPHEGGEDDELDADLSDGGDDEKEEEEEPNDVDKVLDDALEIYDERLADEEMEEGGLREAHAEADAGGDLADDEYEEPPDPTVAVVLEAVLGASGGDEARAGVGFGDREADVEVPFGFGSGRIVHYSSNRSFVAYCGNPAHGRCVLTRSSGLFSEPNARGRRPLGIMATWLAFAEHCPDKGSHWDWAELPFMHEERTEQRQMLMATPCGPLLSVFERGKRGEEPDEPLDLAEYGIV